MMFHLKILVAHLLCWINVLYGPIIVFVPALIKRRMPRSLSGYGNDLYQHSSQRDQKDIGPEPGVQRF